ncbi:MAG: TonB-dependent receptor [Blastocatellia bacterium]|nr:TonB-dependent receptor [Blastocatellia bacterium]
MLGRLLFLYKNIAEVRTYGFEFDGDVALRKGFSFGGAYTNLTARDVEAQRPLTGRHKHQGNIRLAWESHGTSATFLSIDSTLQSPRSLLSANLIFLYGGGIYDGHGREIHSHYPQVGHRRIMVPVVEGVIHVNAQKLAVNLVVIQWNHPTLGGIHAYLAFLIRVEIGPFSPDAGPECGRLPVEPRHLTALGVISEQPVQLDSQIVYRLTRELPVLWFSVRI